MFMNSLLVFLLFSIKTQLASFNKVQHIKTYLELIWQHWQYRIKIKLSRIQTCYRVNTTTFKRVRKLDESWQV